MRIGLVADDDIGIGYHFGSAVGVHVQGHSNRQIGRDLAYPPQQFALAIGNVFGRHRPVQIQKYRVDPARAQWCQDPLA